MQNTMHWNAWVASLTEISAHSNLWPCMVSWQVFHAGGCCCPFLAHCLPSFQETEGLYHHTDYTKDGRKLHRVSCKQNRLTNTGWYQVKENGPKWLVGLCRFRFTKCCDHSVHAVMTKVGIANGPMGWGFHPEVSRRKQKFCSAGVSLVDCWLLCGFTFTFCKSVPSVSCR